MTERVRELLERRGARAAVAESCTGGRLAAAFTGTAGASSYFLGGVVAYDNRVKINVLGVEREVLEKHGAVSRQVAEQMALGARRVCGADFAVSTTGVAGPDGGSAEKPVGTVWIAVAGPRETTGEPAPATAENGAATEEIRAAEVAGDAEVISRRFEFGGSRIENMESAVAAALEMLAGVLGTSSGNL